MSKKLVTYRERRPPKGLEYNGSPAKYSKLPDECYFKYGSGPSVKLSSVKKMIESFPDKPDELKAFVSKEKISKNDRELTMLVQYYNSLR